MGQVHDGLVGWVKHSERNSDRLDWTWTQLKAKVCNYSMLNVTTLHITMLI